MLASTDLVAAHATGARLRGQDEAKVQEALGPARTEGMGALCAEEIELVGGTLVALRTPFKPARPGRFP